MSKIYDQFTHLYKIQKTLRFELKPVGETAIYINDFKSQYLQDVVHQDEQRAEYYKVVKDIIDDYHRDYIEKKLSQSVDTATGVIWVTPEDLEEAYCDYQNLKDNPRDRETRDAWVKRQESLRKKLVEAFSNNNDLFKKELITRDLPALLKHQGKWEENKEAVESFNKFTTYFTGFNENRKNMYSDKDQSTAIAHRVMNENLPRFFNNYLSYQKIKDKQASLEFSVETPLLTQMGVSSIDDIFQPRYFINLFTQSGLDSYQELLGGKTDEHGKKTQGLNEQINLYNQQQLDTKDKLPRFTSLYKQILSDRETNSFIPDAFKDDKELLKTLQDYIDHATKKEGFLERLEKSIELLSVVDNEKVYVKKAGLTDISSAIFNSYGIIGAALWHHAENTVHPNSTRRPATEALIRRRESFCKQDVFSVAELDSIITSYIAQLEAIDPLHQQLKELTDPRQPIRAYFLDVFQQSKQDSELDTCIKNVSPLLSLESLSKKRQAPTLEGDQGDKGYQQLHSIQKMLDAFMTISYKLKPLHLVKGRKAIDMPDMDMGFYAGFSEAYETYSDTIISLYNKTRNHLTKVPFSKEKIKLNFGNPTLLNGWDSNKEAANSSLIFEKDGLYYLGIMHPKHKYLFDYITGIDDIGNDKKIKKKELLRGEIEVDENQGYRKIVYKLLPGANKMLPKVFFSNKRQAYFSPSSEILHIRNTASHSKHGKPQKSHIKADFNINDCHKIIDFFKASINKHPEWKAFNFQFSPTKKYQDLSEFYREVEQQGYKVDFHPIKQSYIDECVEQGKLFLFQIYNKDFSPYSKGKSNLHTLYWKGLFEPENLNDVVLKLNGEAEVFYRRHSIKVADRTIHRANEAISNKNKEFHKKEESTFNYDIIKDRRYTQDKFQFHVPITLNFNAQGVSRFEDKVNLALQKAEDTHVIGIDRGERHLLYYTIVNSKGEIIEQDTLNKISTDQGYVIDYQNKLHKKEKERDKARKSWSSIENIKELKAGYLSHVVHKLAELIIKYDAIVCLEDLNFGFKRGRFSVEKQVYQKFEKALIDKLNYLVFKTSETTSPGHYLNAYQLTAPFKSFEKLGKQSGVLFYVQAAYTSKIDPSTGFIDFLKPKYKSLSASKVFFETMSSIIFNAEKDYFEFSFDYKKFNPSQKFGQYTTQWKACSFGELRYHNKRNNKGIWETRPINVTKELKQLFDDAGIQYQIGQELKESIILVKDTKFYKTLFWLLRLLLSLRHSRTGTDDDFILSPIENEHGVFFDSRNATDKQPKDADANGAYNIALKGLWNLQQIKQWDGEKHLNLSMKNEDWLSFITVKPYKR